MAKGNFADTMMDLVRGDEEPEKKAKNESPKKPPVSKKETKRLSVQKNEPVKEEPEALPEAPVKEAVVQAPAPLPITRYTRPIPENENEDLVRGTYYLTYEQIEAIEEVAHRERIRKSDVVREILQEGLEARLPGVFDIVREYAQIEKQKALAKKR